MWLYRLRLPMLYNLHHFHIELDTLPNKYDASEMKLNAFQAETSLQVKLQLFKIVEIIFCSMKI